MSTMMTALLRVSRVLAISQLLLYSIITPPPLSGAFVLNHNKRRLYYRPGSGSGSFITGNIGPSSHCSSTTSLGIIKGTFYQDGKVDLPPIAHSDLVDLLRHPDMEAEVAKNAMAKEVEYAGVLFQPVPYSVETKHGMPKDVEEKYWLKEDYVVINIPPTILFKAHVFKPSRLCAVYHVRGLSEEGKKRVQKERESVQSRTDPIAAAQIIKEGFEEADVDNDIWKTMGQSLRETFQEKFDEAQNRESQVDDKDFDFDEYIV